MANEITKKEIRELLADQTDAILTAVDERVNKRLADQTDAILTAVDERIQALDEKFTEKLDQLITTLDGFLKRMTDIEQEFAMMREDLNRVKKVIKQKLGVDLM